MRNMQYAEIAVALPVEHLYTYAVPEDLGEEMAVGKRVLVPFGKKYMTGYVVQISQFTDVEKVKELVDVLDLEPIITQNVLRLTKWMAEYYLCSWGVAIKAALPAGIDLVHDTTITLNTSEPKLLEDSVSAMKGSVQKKLVAILHQHPTISLRDLQKKVGKKSLYSSLHALERQGLIQIEQVVKSGKAKPKALQHVTLRQSPETSLAELAVLEKRASHQAEIVKLLVDRFPDDIAVIELQNQIKFDPRTALKALVRKGYVHVYSKNIRRKPLEQFEYQETSHLP
jgi:primosomal protein N' (replication factor Y)